MREASPAQRQVGNSALRGCAEGAGFPPCLRRGDCGGNKLGHPSRQMHAEPMPASTVCFRGVVCPPKRSHEPHRVFNIWNHCQHLRTEISFLKTQVSKLLKKNGQSWTPRAIESARQPGAGLGGRAPRRWGECLTVHPEPPSSRNRSHRPPGFCRQLN